MRARVVAMALFVVAVVVGVFVGVRSFRGANAAAKFDAAVWRRPVAWCSASRRGAMVNGVVAHHLRHGMTMRAVQTVLGVPDEIAADRTWVYDIDFEGDGLLGACVTLELYAKGGRLERAAVMRDD